MAVKTYSEQLEEVQAAIAKAESAQQYSIAGRSKTNADLATLYAREERLRRLVARQTSGGASIRRARFRNL